MAGLGIAWAALRARVPAGESLSNAIEDTVSSITPGPWEPPARAAPYLPAVSAAESRYDIPPMMLVRLLFQESRYREDIITGRTPSATGALGIAQFMPATAAELGIDPLDTDQAIDAAGRYLRRLRDSLAGDWKLALAAYNWGIGNVKRKGLAVAPQETRDYVAQITGDIGYA